MKKGKLTLKVECQLVNIEVWKKSPLCHHGSNNWFRQDSSVDALELLDKDLVRAEYVPVLKYLPRSYLLITKGESNCSGNTWWTPPWPSDQRTNNGKKLTSHAPWSGAWWGHNVACVVFLLKMYNLTRITGKHQTNLNWEKSIGQWACTFQKSSVSRETKVWGPISY